jgi:hypothetical protein
MNSILFNYDVILSNSLYNIIIKSFSFKFFFEIKIYKRKISVISINSSNWYKKIKIIIKINSTNLIKIEQQN